MKKWKIEIWILFIVCLILRFFLKKGYVDNKFWLLNKLCYICDFIKKFLELLERFVGNNFCYFECRFMFGRFIEKCKNSFF